MRQKSTAILAALGAALLYAASIPISPFLLRQTGPVMLAALLYLGAGVGMTLLSLICPVPRKDRLTRRQLPFTLGMILLDIAAPILLMLGLARAPAAHVSLLNNFEIVATSLFALLLFRERISRRVWCAIFLITAASMLLSFEGVQSLRFSAGSLLVLGACLCWGLENNCTRALSQKSAVQIVQVKGLFSGLGSLLVARLAGESLPDWRSLFAAMLRGFVCYGLSIFLYVRAQSVLGAARTSAFYSVNPFLAAALSLLLLRQPLADAYPCALALMLLGLYLTVRETLSEQSAGAGLHNG